MTSPFTDGAVLIIPSGEDPPRDVLRAWVQGVLTGIAAVSRLRVALVAEELVSNAQRHGRLPCVLSLCLDHEQHVLLVYVDDCAEDDGATWPSHSGLALVEGLSLDWGVEQHVEGKAVWAEVALGACSSR